MSPSQSLRPVARLTGFLALGLGLTLGLGGLRPTTADDAPAAKSAPAAPATEKKSAAEKPAVRRELLSGKVVLLSDALKRREIKAYEPEIKGQVVLETAAGDLWPILPDWRGRAFFQDERLRDRPTDLVVLRDAGVPHLRVQSIFLFDEKGERQLMDYWCDICAIPMYEIKDCECCQGPLRLRLQKKPFPAEFSKP